MSYNPLNQIGDYDLVGYAFAALQRSMERGDYPGSMDKYERVCEIADEYRDLNTIYAWLKYADENMPDTISRRNADVSRYKGTWYITVRIGYDFGLKYARSTGFTLFTPLTEEQEDEGDDPHATAVLLKTHDFAELTNKCVEHAEKEH